MMGYYFHDHVRQQQGLGGAGNLTDVHKILTRLPV